jgi:hypothetical protein
MDDIGIFYVHLVNLPAFGISFGHSVYFPRFGIFLPVLVRCTKKNLAALRRKRKRDPKDEGPSRQKKRKTASAISPKSYWMILKCPSGELEWVLTVRPRFVRTESFFSRFQSFLGKSRFDLFKKTVFFFSQECNWQNGWWTTKESFGSLGGLATGPNGKPVWPKDGQSAIQLFLLSFWEENHLGTTANPPPLRLTKK